MRDYQNKIIDAVRSKKNWGGSNVVVLTDQNITRVAYYGNVIGVIDHNNKTCKLDNCGYSNASTTARINAIKTAVDDLGYKVSVV